MPNPHRARYRANETARRVAREPVAFRGTADAHRIDQRERMRPLVGTVGFDARTPEESLRFGRFYNARLESEHPMTDSFPARDSRGRRNPRMARRAFA